ncbi:hypothetical protein BANRA_05173 [Escherichia coli]|nr:hypothetical protein BANRA_05173 [Escherichia coli]
MQRNKDYQWPVKELRSEVKYFSNQSIKAMLMQMCNEDGLTQAEVLTALIKSEAQKRCM